MARTAWIFPPPTNHAELMKHRGRGERELKMTRAQHEAIILSRMSWRQSDPEFATYLRATFLATAGELGSPNSRLGTTRKEALRCLRRRLSKVYIVRLEEDLEDYDLSGPHPSYVFGPGWTEEDQRRQRARAMAEDEREGIETEEQWFADRHRHWYYRLIDWLPSRRRVLYALSIARRWRWMRYSIR